MTTFTDDDKKLIKEIRERIGSLDVRDNIDVGLMKFLWHRWKQKRQICLVVSQLKKQKNYTKIW